MKREGRRWRRIRLRTVRLLVLCLLGAGMVLNQRKDRDWNQDEAITFLESTCHLSDYRLVIEKRTPPYGVWAEARDWQRFLDSEGRLCLGEIRDDLANLDIHPPLYFWLLHLWLLGSGGDRAFMTVMGLNLLLMAVGALALYKLGRTLFASRLDGVVVAFCAVLNPITAYASMEFRPYALLGAATSIYLLTLVRALPAAPTRRRTFWRGAALTLSTAAGLLTHHLFGVVLFAGAVFAAARLVRAPRELLRVGAFSVGGVALALAIFPLFSQIGSNPWAVEPEQVHFDSRERQLLRTFGRALPHFDERQAIVACAVGLIVLLLGFAWNDWPRAGFRRTRGFAIALVAVLVPGALVLQYGLGFSPAHAMTPKYLAAVSPVVGLAVALVFRLLGRHRFALAAGCCTLLALATASRIEQRWARLFANARIVKDHERLILDEVSRTTLPRIIVRVRPETQVFVAEQKYLLESDAWRTGDDFTFVTCVRDGLSRKRSAQLARAFGETHYESGGRKWTACWRTQPFKARR